VGGGFLTLVFIYFVELVSRGRGGVFGSCWGDCQGVSCLGRRVGGVSLMTFLDVGPKNF